MKAVLVVAHCCIQAQHLCHLQGRHAEHCAAIFPVITGLHCSLWVPARSNLIVLCHCNQNTDGNREA